MRASPIQRFSTEPSPCVSRTNTQSTSQVQDMVAKHSGRVGTGTDRVWWPHSPLASTKGLGSIFGGTP